MNLNRLVLLLVAFVLPASAALHAGEIKVQLVEPDGKKVTEFTATEGGLAILRVSVQNQSNVPVTVNYLGAGSTGFLTKVEPKVIEPTDEVFFTVLVDNDTLGVASNFDLAVGYVIATQQKIERTTVRLSAANILQFTPGILTWKIGEDRTEKSATISIPNQIKIVKALSIEGFDVRIDGDKIYAKPLSTTKALSAYVMLRTAPPLRPNRILPLGLAIVE